MAPVWLTVAPTSVAVPPVKPLAILRVVSSVVVTVNVAAPFWYSVPTFKSSVVFIFNLELPVGVIKKSYLVLLVTAGITTFLTYLPSAGISCFLSIKIEDVKVSLLKLC